MFAIKWKLTEVAGWEQWCVRDLAVRADHLDDAIASALRCFQMQMTVDNGPPMSGFALCDSSGAQVFEFMAQVPSPHAT